MKRLSTGVLAALMAAGLGLNAVAAQTGASHGNIGTNAIAQDQGAHQLLRRRTSDPRRRVSIPILFNDHHVYTKPDILKQGRVLAALVRGGTLLDPASLDVRANGRNGVLRRGQQDRDGQQGRRRGQSDRR